LETDEAEPQGPPQAPPPPEPTRSRLVRDSLRIVFFRPVPPERLERGWLTVLLAAALVTLLPTLVAMAVVGPTGRWSSYGLPGALFPVSVAVLAAMAVAAITRRREGFAGYAMAGLLAILVIDASTSVMAFVAEGAPGARQLTWQLRWLPAAWAGLAMGAYALRSIPKGERGRAAFLACLVLVGLPLAKVGHDGAMWHPSRDEYDAGARGMPGIASEEAFYKQPQLLAQELDAVRPGKAGVPEVFFVGLAGYGPQDVFMKEVDAVADLMRQRFGAEGHVVRLVNNPKTVRERPIATRTSLRAALQRVAQRMNGEEDLLVLFLTSHGGEDHKLSLSLWPMRFLDIDPVVLRALLDEAGIRRRVVVVSACYSGGYVQPLEGPDTLVVTAAAKDRTSFGCSNTAQWTYFGQAYFDDALRNTHSFARAFDVARASIEARERKEKIDASLPQVSLGARIAPYLEQLAVDLDRAQP
jgi:hypothetical protein